MNHPTTAPITYPATAAGLSAALAALGPIANAVADTLLAGGYTGRLGSAEDCPLVRYLAAVIPDGMDIAVGDTEAELDTATCPTGDAAADCTCIYVDLPTAVAAFVAAFDAGGYPDLITGADRDDAA